MLTIRGRKGTQSAHPLCHLLLWRWRVWPPATPWSETLQRMSLHLLRWKHVSILDSISLGAGSLHLSYFIIFIEYYVLLLLLRIGIMRQEMLRWGLKRGLLLGLLLHTIVVLLLHMIIWRFSMLFESDYTRQLLISKSSVLPVLRDLLLLIGIHFLI